MKNIRKSFKKNLKRKEYEELERSVQKESDKLDDLNQSLKEEEEKVEEEHKKLDIIREDCESQFREILEKIVFYFREHVYFVRRCG